MAKNAHFGGTNGSFIVTQPKCLYISSGSIFFGSFWGRWDGERYGSKMHVYMHFGDFWRLVVG